MSAKQDGKIELVIPKKIGNAVSEDEWQNLIDNINELEKTLIEISNDLKTLDEVLKK